MTLTIIRRLNCYFHMLTERLDVLCRSYVASRFQRSKKVLPAQSLQGSYEFDDYIDFGHVSLCPETLVHNTPWQITCRALDGAGFPIDISRNAKMEAVVLLLQLAAVYGVEPDFLLNLLNNAPDMQIVYMSQSTETWLLSLFGNPAGERLLLKLGQIIAVHEYKNLAFLTALYNAASIHSSFHCTQLVEILANCEFAASSGNV